MHLTEGQAHGLEYYHSLIDQANSHPDLLMKEILSKIEGDGFRGLSVTFPHT
ncbi:hypothetical protein [Puniceibacterium sediminis]|uniref:Uncharacterized protein n=1 Tax=Puniceibacterium sediminis TaxID=1608407 RepID=A0A238W8L2_9RHOB|nr:hypothetical protein [Puniceibacterium sediminis]SNR42935.1 hypothetical protein SAMN06265370_104268 [Puniceibacterium sediminis]